jgi:hypothetical protein
MLRDDEGRYPLHYLSMHTDNEELAYYIADKYVLL